MNSIKKMLTLLVVIVALIGAVALSSLNAESAALNLYWFKLNWPLGFMLLVFAALGVMFGLVLSWLFWLWPCSRQKTHWQRAYFRLKQETDAQNEAEQTTNALTKVP